MPSPSTRRHFGGFLSGTVTSGQRRIAACMRGNRCVHLFIRVVNKATNFCINHTQVCGVACSRSACGLRHISTLLHGVLLVCSNLCYLGDTASAVRVVGAGRPCTGRNSALGNVTNLLQGCTDRFIRRSSQRHFLRFVGLPSLQRHMRRDAQPTTNDIFHIGRHSNDCY